KASASSGQLEGSIDLVVAFGSLPSTIYLCAAAYQTADGGALAGTSMAGTGNDLDPCKFFAIPTIALRDNNADGKFDRLDPNLDFLMLSIQHLEGGCALNWAAMPGQAYLVVSSEALTDSWSNLSASLSTDAPLQTSLSSTDAP